MSQPIVFIFFAIGGTVTGGHPITFSEKSDHGR